MTGIQRLKLSVAVAGLSLGWVGSADQKTVSVADCTFETAPEEYLLRQTRVREDVFDRTVRLGGKLPRAAASQTVPAESIPIRNFIDAEIFGKLASLKVPSARLATDEEFFRRIHLDVTGRIPSAGDVRAFLDDRSPGKRDEVIDRLLASPEFVDRWTMWLGDLLQNTQAAANFNRGTDARNAFHAWIRRSVAEDKSLHDIAWESVALAGNNLDSNAGATNFAVGATTPMGPVQDTYDTMLVRSATAFLGMAHYDCLLCHDGIGHLTQISVWGTGTLRGEAQRMAAFFSRMQLAAGPGGSRDVVDRPAGQYDLNTNFGNRPNRIPIGNLRNLTPQYRLGATPSNGDWRTAFAEEMTKDPMFARNLANRIWKQFFNLGLVDPVDTMDPARLEPDKPPAAPWTLQATHPVLLERLAKEMEIGWYPLRGFIRTIVRSSAYQLSSRYDGPWKIDYVPLFARHYPRRLEGEEVHDAIAAATGMTGRYTVQGWAEPVLWAVQLPEPVEPRSNGAVANFMNSFVRGNRDTQPRSQSGSILQQLYLMNDPLVLNRVKMAASPALQEIARQDGNDAAIDELWLTFLSRRPAADERAVAMAFLGRANSAAARNAALEDLAWVMINKLEFVFSW